jgi:methionyl-tRNA formyltransferase
MESVVSNIIAKPRPPRALFFGMQGNFSAPFLTALLDSGIEVAAVVVPASPLPGSKRTAIQRRERPRFMRTILPLANASLHSSILQTAWAQELPVWEVQRLADPETLATLAAYQSDVICVACFSMRIPRVIIDLPLLGCLNVHPALLPANRGPVPLFWTFREGHTTSGVTIHLIDEGMDSGDILAQESLPVPDGISYDALEWQCIQLGKTLLAQMVWSLSTGQATPTPQDKTQSSYHPFPREEDFAISAEDWSAHRVYNFVRGVHTWGNPILLHTDEKTYHVHDALAYRQNGQASKPIENAHMAGPEMIDVWVRCRAGKVLIRSSKGRLL